MTLCSFRSLLVRLLPVLVLGLFGVRSMAQADPPGRVARLNDADGPVVFSPAGDDEWTDAAVNRPLTRGDRLWTDRGSRADVQVGSAAVRMNGQTHLEIAALNDRSAQLNVAQGSVYARVRDVSEGENFEIDTPNLAFRAAYSGEYRIDVDALNGTTRVTVHSGMGAVFGEGGPAMMLGGGQQITFRARSLNQVTTQESPPQDAFDRWAVERNRREDQSVSARYVPREVVGYQQLDAYGQWGQDATQGIVWYPYVKVADWAPYRQGHWEWISPWGWTWIDDAPWGFAPFHYGRWSLIGSRWAWVPGRIGAHPVYAPALVAFVGGGINWSISSVAGRPGVAWFPLAPGEAWQPGYTASPLYISNVNRNMPPQAVTSYAHQHSQQALTAISADDFHRGRPVRTGWLRTTAMALTQAQVVPPPPRPERSGAVAHQHTTTPRMAPAAAADARQVVSNIAQVRATESMEFAQRERAIARQQEEETQKQIRQTQQQQLAAQQQAESQRTRQIAEQERGQREQAAQRAAQAKNGQQARLTDQSRRAEQVKAEKQAKHEQLAKRTERAEHEQRAKLDRQAKLEQQAKHATQARREQQTRNEQLARRADQARREEQVRRAEQMRRETLARREQMQRRETHLQQLEQARRAAEREAQALREQRARRDEQAQREARERQVQREASQRQQQVLNEQLRRDQQAWEQQQQQRERPRHRPDLRVERHTHSPDGEPSDAMRSQAG